MIIGLVMMVVAVAIICHTYVFVFKLFFKGVCPTGYFVLEGQRGLTDPRICILSTKLVSVLLWVRVPVHPQQQHGPMHPLV